MSIPPLVCSTPPPPDQCEDDKDPEDFDIGYNLSQEDDAYDYGNFSSFNHFSSAAEVKKDVLCNNIDALTLSENRTEYSPETEVNIENHHNYVGTNITDVNTKCDEDINIEDLNLEINDDPVTSAAKDDIEPSSDSPENINSENDASELSLNSTPSSPCEDNVIENPSPDKEEIIENEIVEPPYLEAKSKSNNTCNNNDNDLINENVIEPIDKLKNSDDEFGDFDDFQFASDTKLPAVEICDNPWESNDAEPSEFGNFTANFDAVTQPIEPVETSSEIPKESQESETVINNDDDFGDFDDFKSSKIEPNISNNDEITRDNPVLNFQMSGNENQVIESIAKVLSTIFDEEVTDPGCEYETKLESCLSVAWNHLKDTDVRQPYIVNWNSSIGQKTLLKALCIDSRNILFGPKWSYNTPKFATNLSVAPLQPQKPATPSTPSEVTEKPTPKDGTWVDPFTSDGQESCNNENEPPVEAVQNVDVFEAALTPKTDKIYSTTLNVQPLRHINLPDTHIFTPTDSETPRSKTIHYNGPPILLPQNVKENTKVSIQDKEDDDYWEFQDFKSSNETSNAPSQDIEKSDTFIKPNITYQTQVLQPIKMEPIMPTLNWPDPGEVKETFEDFSDFISSTTLKNDSQPKLENKSVPEKTETSQKADFDVDFDTFKSVLPQKSDTEFTFNSLPNNIPHTSQINTNFDCTFPNIETKSNTLDVNTSELIPTKTIMPINSTPSVLQPIQATVKPQTGQILQPLSLESYSQINWPNPGINLQDLSRFNPVETLQSLKSDLSGGSSKGSPVNTQKVNQPDDDIWGEFISSKPKQTVPKKQVFADDDEWTDFVSSPTVKPQNGLNTISLNVHTSSNIQKNNKSTKNQIPIDIPTLNYITPKSGQSTYNNKHFQNL